MTHKKIVLLMVLVLILFLFSAGELSLLGHTLTPVPQETQEEVSGELRDKDQEKKAEKETESGFDKMLEKRMAEGETLFEVFGLPTAEDYMPTTLDLIILWTIPISALAGILILVLILSKRRHQQMMAMIEKGITSDADTLRLYRSMQLRWDLFFLGLGLICILGGVGVSLYMIGSQGLSKWYIGVIPVFVGCALLAFYRIYSRLKSKEQEK